MNSWGFFAIFFLFSFWFFFFFFLFLLDSSLSYWSFARGMCGGSFIFGLLKIEAGGTEGARFVTRDVGRLWRFFFGLFMNRFGAAFWSLVITLGGSYRALVMLWNLELNRGNGCCKDFGVAWTVDFASSFGIRLSFKEDLSPAAMRWPFLSWILSSFVA
jgi:phosphate/sulfate permease